MPPWSTVTSRARSPRASRIFSAPKYGVAGSRRFWIIRMSDGPSEVILVGFSAGASFQNAQGVMLVGIPAVSG